MITWEYNSFKVALWAVVAGNAFNCVENKFLISTFIPGLFTVNKLQGIVYLVELQMQRIMKGLCA